MRIRVFVTHENPIDVVRDASIPSIDKYFDSVDEANEFARFLLAQGFNISLNAWNEEED